MDSVFCVDRTVLRDSSLPTFVYNRDRLPIHKIGNEGRDYNHAEEEVELFGLKIDREEVDNAVSFSQDDKLASEISVHLDEVAGKVTDAVEKSIMGKPTNRKRITELDYISGLDLSMRHENMEKNMQKSRRTLDPGLEQRSALSTVSKRLQPVLNRFEREKTKGSGWFNLPATEINEEMRNDLKIIQMRSVLNPKQFYKKNDFKLLPKYFEIGVVEHSALDHYKEKNTRKTKKSLVDDLLQDGDFQKFNKRKYNETIQSRAKYAHRKNIKIMNKNKKK